MLVYFIIWLILTFLICFSFGKSTNTSGDTSVINYGLIIIAGMVYVLFGAFRKIYSHTDTYAYSIYFNNAVNVSLPVYLNQSIFEPMYTLIIWIFRQFTSDFRIVLVFFYSIIFLMQIYLLNYAKPNKYRYLCIAVLNLEMFSAYYLLRNYLSICLGFVCIILCYKKKFFKSTIFMILAIMFHTSALILFPIIIFNFLLDRRDKIKKGMLILFIILSVMCTYVLSGFMIRFMNASDKYHVYSNVGSLALGTLVCTIIIIIFSLKKSFELTQISSFNKTLIISLCASLIVIPLQLQYSIMYRMNLFFIPLQFILLMELQGIYKKKGIGFYFIRIFTVAFSIYKIYSFFSDELQHIIQIQS